MPKDLASQYFPDPPYGYLKPAVASSVKRSVAPVMATAAPNRPNWMFMGVYWYEPVHHLRFQASLTLSTEGKFAESFLGGCSFTARVKPGQRFDPAMRQ